MRFTILIIAFVIFSIAFVFSCSDEKIIVQSVDKFAIDQFPNTVGSHWLYNIVDTISGRQYSLSVVISDTLTILDNLPVTQWLYFDSDFVAIFEYVSIIEDTAFIYRYNHDYDTILFSSKIVFPIETGNKWSYLNNYGFEVCSVLAPSLINIPTGNFWAYQLDFSLSPMMLDLVKCSKFWLSPDKGIIRREIIEGFRIVEKHEIWELVEYHIAER